MRRVFGKYRRALAALLAGFACLVALAELRPPPPQTSAYIATRSALAAGHVLTEADITTLDWPQRLPAPPAFMDRDAVLGRTIAGPLAIGELISESRLVGPGLLEIANIASDDRNSQRVVAAPVRLADPGQAALVRPGDLVDVLAARAVDGGGQTATVVAADATVITIPGSDEAISDSGLIGSGSSSNGLGQGHLVVLAVGEYTATDLAAAATRSQLSVVLKAPLAAIPTESNVEGSQSAIPADP